MNKERVIEKTIGYVKEVLAKDSTGHDWWHIYRVWKMACCLAEKEGADRFVVELTALLHDIADWKFSQGDDRLGPQKAAAWLASLQVDEQVIQQVSQTIQDMSFKGAGVQSPSLPTLEGRIVQDADRLDAIGAIGIARTFAYGGYKGRPLHDPNISATYHDSFAAYKNHQGTTLNHFHEKLLLLKDLMNTQTAKQIAQERHAAMETFVQRFLAEWDAIA
ncbi:MAG: phosphohydrolase [Gammaproteobacteria bacterium]|jgi:uncharacterized protein|nr:phosphohydrolase [Gammaproteobacteria bacterium]